MDNAWNISRQGGTYYFSQHNRIGISHWAGFLRLKQNLRAFGTLFKEWLLRVQSASDHEFENSRTK